MLHKKKNNKLLNEVENKPNSQHSDMHRWLAHKLFNVSNRWLPTRLPSYTLTRIHGTDSIHNCSINIPEQYNSHSAHHRESRNKNSKSTCPPPAQQQIIIRNTEQKVHLWCTFILCHVHHIIIIILLSSTPPNDCNKANKWIWMSNIFIGSMWMSTKRLKCMNVICKMMEERRTKKFINQFHFQL